MYLKSLEIQGFKSFPTPTRMVFDKPITGIVGPNGSGKSNISDALLWVMGEQSTKTLRGGKMEDVIFGGTQRRSQMNYAEVSLIFDNSEGRLEVEGAEVMLTRRYFRSGDSEYLINQTPVRLKDVNDILMDTGLGREGYCIIGQGRIAEILSTKSKDRRDIFEEATGISRYRHRKDESERKLQQTEENLLRIGDKISELELNLEPTREEAELAKRYLILRDEIRGLEISLWLRELETLSARIEKAEIDFTTAERVFEAAKQEYDSQSDEFDLLSEANQKSNTDADLIRDEISNSESKHSTIESDILVMKSKLEGNAGQIESISRELQSQNEQHDGVGLQISDQKERLEEIEAEKKNRDEKIDALNNELQEISKTTGESSDAHTQLIEKESTLQTNHSDMKSELSALISQAQELLDSEHSVEQELSAAKADLKEHEKNHELSKKELIKSQEEVQVLENVIKGLTIKAENRAKKADSVADGVEQLNYDLKSMESRKDILTEMEKEYDGYSKSVQRVMHEHSRGTLKNIHGTVGGLIKTDENYAIAIETALGYAMQNIIVSTDDDGEAAINYLKRRDGGRATFLPISVIKGNNLNENEFKNDAGFEGLAINLVKYDSKYKNIYSNLLGRVIVTDDLNNAKKMARKHERKYKIVTLDGQVINAGGSMTGGSKANTAGVLSRANELQQLDSRMEKCKSEHVLRREFPEAFKQRFRIAFEERRQHGNHRVPEDKQTRKNG